MSNPTKDEAMRRRAPVPKEICPMALAANRLGDRWTLLILREAFYGIRRFDDIRADLGVSRAMLADRLSRMVEDGLLDRRPYREPGSRARDAYVLTRTGASLALTLIAMTQWGEAHITGKDAPIEIIDPASGLPLRVTLIDPSGAEVAATDARIRVRSEAVL